MTSPFSPGRDPCLPDVAQRVLDELPVPVAVVSEHGRVLVWNRAAETAWRVPACRAAGADLAGLVPPAPAALLPALGRAAAGAVVQVPAGPDGGPGPVRLARLAGEGAHGGLVLIAGMSRTGVGAATPADPGGPPPGQLTARQRDVLTLVASGHSTEGVSRELGIGLKTVETHRRNLRRRLGIRDLAGLVRYAMRHGLVPPP